jgi:hypothetical protein
MHDAEFIEGRGLRAGGQNRGQWDLLYWIPWSSMTARRPKGTRYRIGVRHDGVAIKGSGVFYFLNSEFLALYYKDRWGQTRLKQPRDKISIETDPIGP